MAKKKDPSILGHWRITGMEFWDKEYVDAEVKAYFRFDPNGRGEFQFGYVSGWMDYRPAERKGRPAVEWSWEGRDEMDPRSGRGWAMLGQDDKLAGRIFLHDADDSAFTAKRTPEPSGRKRA